ncbi:hypothetical protein SAMN05216312_105429 [Cohnella sp. OV330]|uniref:hypothetical protein n=1 Tax=Cohnella sp. OV330 TaxID=1855288 RepID=UPI0008E320E4|nr:hypothetical protein [Cohnella sp. OV330]SFB30641.1 hypothetical protein SAMN05216312_105429 [Cohnella sp. OV330]
MKKNSGWAVVLIALGVLLLFGKLGHLVGWIIGLLIPIAIIGLGVMAWRNGYRLIGIVIGIIGGFMLLGKLSVVIFWVAAIGLIVLGISMLNGKTGRTRRW